MAIDKASAINTIIQNKGLTGLSAAALRVELSKMSEEELSGFLSNTQPANKGSIDWVNDVEASPNVADSNNRTAQPEKASSIFGQWNFDAKAIASRLYELNDNFLGAVEEQAFQEELSKINEDNVIDVLAEYKKKSPNESLLEAICDEKASSNKARQQALSKIFGDLTTKAQNSGVDTEHFEKEFQAEVNSQFGKFGFVSSERMDSITDAVVESAKEKSILTPEERLRISQQSQSELQKAATDTLAKKSESARKSFDVQMKQDGWAADVADKTSILWGSENRANVVREDLAKFDAQVKELQDAQTKGPKVFEDKFYETFGKKFDAENVAAYQKKEQQYQAAVMHNTVETNFNSYLDKLLKNPKLKDEVQVDTGNSQFAISQLRVTATRDEVYERELNKFAELVGQGDAKVGRPQIETVMNARGINLETASMDDKYSILHDLAVDYSNSLHSKTMEATGDKSFEQVEKEYQASYNAAFGMNNDIAKRVTEYNFSQQAGAGIVKGGVTLVGTIAVGVATNGAGLSLVPALATTAAGAAEVTLLTEGSDRLSSGFVTQATKEGFANGGLLGATKGFVKGSQEALPKEEIERILLSAGVNGVSTFAGGISAQGINALKVGVLAKSAAYVASDVGVGAAGEYAQTGTVTIEGVAFSAAFSATGQLVALRKIGQAETVAKDSPSEGAKTEAPTAEEPLSNAGNKSGKTKINTAELFDDEESGLINRITGVITDRIRVPHHDEFSITGRAQNIRALSQLQSEGRATTENFCEEIGVKTYNPEGMKEYMNKLTAQMEALDGEFKKLAPSLLPATYYRGFVGKVTDNTLSNGVNTIKAAKVGDVIKPDSGYAYASKDKEVAEGYSRYIGGSHSPEEQVLMTIKVPPLSQVSRNPSHLGEVVLPRNAEFKVLSKVQEDGVTKITLEYQRPNGSGKTPVPEKTVLTPELLQVEAVEKAPIAEKIVATVDAPQPQAGARPDLDKFKLDPQKKYGTQSHFDFHTSNPDLFAGNSESMVWSSHIPKDGTKGAWKMHLYSVDEADWQKMADTVIPYLNEKDVDWKTFSSVHAPERLAGKQRGKAFTIYPKSNADFEQIAKDLDYIVSNNDLKTSGSNIVGDRALGDTGRLFYRYEYKSGSMKDTILDVNKPADRAVYDRSYDGNRGEGRYLAADMTEADDPFRSFKPGTSETSIARPESLSQKPAVQKIQTLEAQPQVHKYEPFKIRDKKMWDECVRINEEGYDPTKPMGTYGVNTLKYTAKWASLMEQRMAAGEKLEDIFYETATQARIGAGGGEGISRQSVAVLSKAWKHGPQLKKAYCKSVGEPYTFVGTQWRKVSNKMRDFGETVSDYYNDANSKIENWLDGK